MALLSACSELFFSHFPKVALAQFVFWLGYVYTKKPQIVDVGWATCHCLIGWLIATQGFSDFSSLSNLKTQLYLGVLTLWFIRLGGYLFYDRIIKQQEPDPRYEFFARKFKNLKPLIYFFQFQQQGFIMMLTAFPLYFLFHQKSSSFALNNYIGLALSVIGTIYHAISDMQLYNFKQNRRKDEKNKVFRGGLWKKSRHPNLFFDVVTWTGFAISALDMNNIGGTSWAFLGPLILWAAMNFITTPITEKHMKQTKPNYDRVIQETNKFIPI